MYAGDTVGYVSPYPTEEVQTSVKVPGGHGALGGATNTPEPESEAPGDDANTLLVTYAAQRGVPPFDVGGGARPLVVHFASNAPIIRVDRLVRDISLSHWSGVVNVEEHYTPMRNGGAAWKGEFVRREYQSAGPSGSTYAKNSFTGYISMLPPNAFTIWLRDSIGNISTSAVRPGLDATSVQVSTRYPLLGGWRSTHTFGYSVPLHSVVKVGEDGRFQATVQFGPTAPYATVDELLVRVVLPLGASDVSYAVPFGVEELPDELTPGPLTHAGRKTLVLRKINAGIAHTADFVVFYRIGFLQLLRQPAWLGGWVLLALGLLVYGTRSDWRISRGVDYKSAMAKKKLSDVANQVREVLNALERRGWGELRAVGDLCAQHGQADAGKARVEKAEARMADSKDELSALLAAVGDLDPSRQNAASALGISAEELGRLARLSLANGQAVSSASMDAAAYAKAREGIAAQQAAGMASLDDLCDKIDPLFEAFED